MQGLEDQYGPRGLTVLLLAKSPAAEMDKYAKEHGVTLRVLCDASADFSAYKIDKWPTSVLVGKDGNVAHVGAPGDLERVVTRMLELEEDAGAVLRRFAETSIAADAAGRRSAIERLVEIAPSEFDLAQWARSVELPSASSEEGGAEPQVPDLPDPAKALAELCASTTAPARRAALRAALSEKAPQAFDLSQWSREAFAVAFPLLLPEAKELLAQSRVRTLLDALADRRPATAVVDFVAKSKELKAQAAARAGEARSDARRALLALRGVIEKGRTLEEAKALAYWGTIESAGEAAPPGGAVVALIVSGERIDAGSARWVDRRLRRALVLEAISSKKPSLATLAVDFPKARKALEDDVTQVIGK